MSVAQFSIHQVHRVEISAYSDFIADLYGSFHMHCQTIKLFNAADQEIGEVVLFLDDPKAAIAIGDLSRLECFQPLEVESTL